MMTAISFIAVRTDIVELPETEIQMQQGIDSTIISQG